VISSPPEGRGQGEGESAIVAFMTIELVDACLQSGEYVDSASPQIAAFAARLCGDASDDITRASACLGRGSGFCVAKAALLAAAARAVGIPARVGFADVRNHLTTPKLRRLMGSDTFYHHGYTELFLEGKWVKATPAFDRRLCEKFGVRPLEFDGRADSLFHPYDVAGRRHMEYIADHGPSADVPVDEILEIFTREYPGLMAADASATRFRVEAEEVRRRKEHAS